MTRPTALRRDGPSRLIIEWDDGSTRNYTARRLRDECPCATCREKRTAPAAELPILNPGEMKPIQIESMQPIGNYAYNIAFSDQHNTGIYTFELLLNIAE